MKLPPPEMEQILSVSVQSDLEDLSIRTQGLHVVTTVARNKVLQPEESDYIHCTHQRLRGLLCVDEVLIELARCGVVVRVLDHQVGYESWVPVLVLQRLLQAGQPK